MEEEFDMAAQNLNRILEPAVIIILAVVVGVLVWAIYGPMFKLGTQMMDTTRSAAGK
jgi:type IV pilus assembly protein PilC